MINLDEIAATGSPLVVTALGMGTVFTCLTILYLLTHLMGKVIPRLLQPPKSVRSASSAPSTEKDDEPATRSANETPATDQEGVAAAITIALARTRLARRKPSPRESTGVDGWKMAGRVQALRKR